MNTAPRPASSQMGFEEIAHTADCAIRAWGPDLVSLLTQAALGLNAVSGVRIGRDRVSREVALHAPDAEGLLVAFLNELVFEQEHQQLAFRRFRLESTARDLTGSMRGSHWISIARPIKAVTFNELRIRPTTHGLEAVVVFDV